MREPTRRALLLAILLAGCTPEPAPTTPPADVAPPNDASSSEVVSDADDADDVGRAVERAPEPPDEAALRAAALAAAASADLTPKRRKPGKNLAMPQKDTRRLAGWWEGWDVRGGGGLKTRDGQVDWASVYFRRLPTATLDPAGTLTVQWETRSRAPAGVIYVGMRVEEDPFAAPRYRNHKFESRKGNGSVHQATASLGRLLSPKYDVNGIRERGYGEIAWQVEQLQPETGSTSIYEGRTAFRLQAAGERLELVALPTVVLGPFVHQVAKDRFIVSFETDVPTTAAVAVTGRTPALLSKPSRRHEVAIEGLRADTSYAYQVAVSDGAETSVTPVRTMKTQAESGTVRLAILSDSRSGVGPGREAYSGVNANVLGGLMSIAHRQGASAIFFPGDLIDGYSTHVDDFDHELRMWLHVVEPVAGTLPIYTGMGNHEASIDMWEDGVTLSKLGKNSAEARFAALMVNPGGAPAPESDDAPPYDETVYSADVGSVHLVMLNTNYWPTSHPGHTRRGRSGNREGYIMDGQMAWLEADLAAARKAGAEHIIVMGHEPAFPIGGHIKDAMWWKGEIDSVNEMRERFWSILAKHRVLAYVSGDEHNYSRALIGPETVKGAERGVYSVISGGCGAPYYAATPPKEYADRLQTFSAQQHVTIWTFEPGEPPQLEVYGLTGGLIESVSLTGKDE